MREVGVELRERQEAEQAHVGRQLLRRRERIDVRRVAGDEEGRLRHPPRRLEHLADRFVGGPRGREQQPGPRRIVGRRPFRACRLAGCILEHQQAVGRHAKRPRVDGHLRVVHQDQVAGPEQAGPEREPVPRPPHDRVMAVCHQRDPPRREEAIDHRRPERRILRHLHPHGLGAPRPEQLQRRTEVDQVGQGQAGLAAPADRHEVDVEIETGLHRHRPALEADPGNVERLAWPANPDFGIALAVDLLHGDCLRRSSPFISPTNSLTSPTSIQRRSYITRSMCGTTARRWARPPFAWRIAMPQ